MITTVFRITCDGCGDYLDCTRGDDEYLADVLEEREWIVQSDENHTQHFCREKCCKWWNETQEMACNG